MEDETWSFDLHSSSSRTYRSAFRSLADLIDYEEVEGDEEELRMEYACPYCEEDFDLVELCGHIHDGHAFETTSELCPVCAMMVGVDMVGHIVAQHGDILKSVQKLKLQKGESSSTLRFLKKELEDDYLQSLLASKSSIASLSKMEADLLASFLSNVSSDNVKKLQPCSSTEEASEEKSSDENSESNGHSSSLTDEEHMEKTRRSKFVQGLLLSTIFVDSL